MDVVRSAAAAFTAIVGAVSAVAGHPVPAAVAGGLAIAVLVVTYVRTPRKHLGRSECKQLAAYVKARLAASEADLPAGVSETSDIRMRDYFDDDSLYVAPTVAVKKGRPEIAGRNLPRELARELREGRRILLLGEPGVGKTLASRLVYRQMARAFIEDPRSAPVPITVALRDVRDVIAAGADGDGLATTLHGALGKKPPLGVARIAMLLRQSRLVLVLDGLDELPIERSTPTPLPRQIDAALDMPVLLTSREAYYDLYVDANANDRFDVIAVVEKLPFDPSGKEFIRRYCDRFGLSSASTLIALIEQDRSILDVVSRPLLLFMATDVLASAVANDDLAAFRTGHGEWTTARVYQMYIDKWLDHERRKGATLPALDMQDLCQEIAWSIFLAAYQGGKKYGDFEIGYLVIGRANLRDLVTAWAGERGLETAVVFDEVRTKSFLIRSDGDDRYHFAHKSFFEFFTARYAVAAFMRNPAEHLDDVMTILGCPLPDEVVNFIRRILERTATTVPAEGALVRRMLFAVVGATSGEQDGARLMARQQAANLLPIVLRDDPAGRRSLLAAYRDEHHPFVRRAIAVGFALHLDDGSLLAEFVEELDADSDAASFHLGYNRIYYGDQHAGASGWRDDGTPECTAFFRATLRQLQSTAYRHLWPMSLWTAATLLSDPERLSDLAGHSDLRSDGWTLRQFALVHHNEASALGAQAQRVLAVLDHHGL
ncbi:MAG TPA: NACHT domain-containing protein [Frankiaceae bacterium]|jgi:hypothetical protein|nr:NACHT domain-containing protein [Frankiaceae bacterium]